MSTETKGKTSSLAVPQTAVAVDEEEERTTSVIVVDGCADTAAAGGSRSPISTTDNATAVAVVDEGEERSTTSVADVCDIAAAASGSPSTTISTSALPGLDPRDNLEKAFEWMENGRFDIKGLAKQLPFTARGLQDGSRSPEQLAEDLGVYVLFRRPFDGTNLIEIVTTHLADRGIPPPNHSKEYFCGPGAQQRYEVLTKEFLGDLRENSLKEIQKKARAGAVERDYFVRSVRTGFRRTCVEWADRLDIEIFQGMRGSYLRMCPVLEPVEFDKLVNAIMKLFCSFMKNQILISAKEVAHGTHEADKTCWECGRTGSDGEVLCCGKCGVAAYCSRDCQTTAWREGHKKMCKLIKTRFEGFEESITTVEAMHAKDAMHQKGGSLNRRHLNGDMEYDTTVMMFSIPDPFSGHVPGPSMTVYYRNLSRVVDGEWWLFPETDSVNVYQTKLIGCESNYHRTLSAILGFDFYAYVAAQSSDGTAEPLVVSQVCGDSAFLQSLLVTYGVAMPAERYLELYEDSDVSANPTDRNRVHRQCRAIFVSELRDKYHKYESLPSGARL